jgi:hypothetical protein
MKRLSVITLCALGLVAAGCGGSNSNAPLTKAQYQSKLSKIAAEAKSSQQSIAQSASSAKTVAQLEDAVRRFAAAGDKFGTELANLNPPADAKAANAALVKGEHDNAAATRAVIPALSAYKTVAAALSYLGSHAPTKGGKEIQTALAKLKQLGYTTGS